MKYDEDVKKIQRRQQMSKKKGPSSDCDDEVSTQPVPNPPTDRAGLVIGRPVDEPVNPIVVDPNPIGINPPPGTKPVPPGYGIDPIPGTPEKPGVGLPVEPKPPIPPHVRPPIEGVKPPGIYPPPVVHPLPPGINPPPTQPLPPGIYPPPTQPPIDRPDMPEIPPAYQIGDPNMWQLLEAGVVTGGFVSQTKAMYIHAVGCAIRTSIFTENGVTETDIFVPNTKIINDVNNGKKVVKF